MQTPTDVRSAEVSGSPSGYIAPSGTQAFKSALDGNASAFVAWRRDPMTRKVLGAVQDAVLHLPNGLSNDDRLVQYGMTQGLVYAMQLMTDPSTLWPGVFGKGTEGESPVTMPMMDFDTSLDDVVGN